MLACDILAVLNRHEVALHYSPVGDRQHPEGGTAATVLGCLAQGCLGNNARPRARLVAVGENACAGVGYISTELRQK
jgi:hypothetical protein